MSKLFLCARFCHVRVKYGNICSRKDFFSIPENHIKYAKATKSFNDSMGGSVNMIYMSRYVEDYKSSDSNIRIIII